MVTETDMHVCPAPGPIMDSTARKRQDSERSTAGENAHHRCSKTALTLLYSNVYLIPEKPTKMTNNSDLIHKFSLNCVFELGSRFQNVIFFKSVFTPFPYWSSWNLMMWMSTGKEWVKCLPRDVFLIGRLIYRWPSGCRGAWDPPNAEMRTLSEISKPWCVFRNSTDDVL